MTVAVVILLVVCCVQSFAIFYLMMRASAFEDWTINNIAKVDGNVDFIAQCINKQMPFRVGGSYARNRWWED